MFACEDFVTCHKTIKRVGDSSRGSLACLGITADTGPSGGLPSMPEDAGLYLGPPTWHCLELLCRLWEALARVVNAFLILQGRRRRRTIQIREWKSNTGCDFSTYIPISIPTYIHTYFARQFSLFCLPKNLWNVVAARPKLVGWLVGSPFSACSNPLQILQFPLKAMFALADGLCFLHNALKLNLLAGLSRSWILSGNLNTGYFKYGFFSSAYLCQVSPGVTKSYRVYWIRYT